MTALAKNLRKRAELRRLEGWELSDVMTPAELDQVADEIERLAGALELYADPGNWQTENGLYLYSDGVDAASLVWEWSPETPSSPWERARLALSGEPTP